MAENAHEADSAARKKLTRLIIYTLVRNWMVDGMPTGADRTEADEAEVWRILKRIMPNDKVSSGD